MSVFEPHGDTRIDVRGRIVILEPQGDLNEEEVRRILHRIDSFLPAFGGKPWAVLYKLSHPNLLTPRAEHSATLASPLLTASGLSALAVVRPEGSSGHLQEAQVRSIYADTACPIRLFDNEADGLAWATTIIGE